MSKQKKVKKSRLEINRYHRNPCPKHPGRKEGCWVYVVEGPKPRRYPERHVAA